MITPSISGSPRGINSKGKGGNSLTIPLGISYQQNLYVAGMSERGNRKINTYTVRTYYHYKFSLPKYLVNFFSSEVLTGGKKMIELSVIKERIRRYHSSKFDLSIFKVDFNIETGVVLISGETNLPFDREALIELRAMTYTLYAEWRDEMVDRFNLYNRYKRRPALIEAA